MHARAILVGIANLLALVFVIGVISHGYFNEANNKTTLPIASTNNAVAQEEEIALTPLKSQARKIEQIRSLKMGKSGSKGKGSDEPDCIPLYPTPAPTKGKGTMSRKLMMMSSMSKGGMGMSKGKGKGKTDSPVSFS